MHPKTTRIATVMAASVIALSAITTYAAEKKKSEAPDMMEACAAAGSTNKNHQLLEPLVGDWDYRVKSWMIPNSPPQESSGVTVNKFIMDGRFLQYDHRGEMEMPNAEGKVVSQEFLGRGITGYSNTKKHFFSAWIDNMSTDMSVLHGTYDDAAKSFTYRGKMNCPMCPKKTLKVREVIKIISPDQYVLEWYDNRSGKEARTMEITYTRR